MAASSDFHFYKTYQVYVTAVPHFDHQWRPLGIILKPGSSRSDELKRILGDQNYHDALQAQSRALELCKEWIDGQAQ
jgi:hypothetical protein